MAKNHDPLKNLRFTHKPTTKDDGSGGACLTKGGKHGDYTPKDSCSYRWQAHLISKKPERNKIYDDLHERVKQAVKTSTVMGKDGKEKVKAYYVASLPPPRKGDWDLDGPLDKPKGSGVVDRGAEKIGIGQNFTKDRWPYWHNAHHIIPKSLLLAAINAIASEDKPQAPKMIKVWLVSAKYNMHFGTNMVILPQDREIGDILNLPTHLILVERDAQGKIMRAELRSHKKYDNYVRDELTEIIGDFCDQIDSENCTDKKTAVLAKARLDKLSTTTYEEILAFGKIAKGAPLADIPTKGSP